MKKGICIFLITFFLFICGCVLFCLGGCERPVYTQMIGWDCDVATFEAGYMPLYRAEMQRLKDKYGLEYSIIEERHREENYVYYICYLYNDIYTVKLYLFSHGAYTGEAYYYQTPETNLVNFEEQRSVVSFLNDFTNYAAFGTRSVGNPYEELFYQAQAEGGYVHLQLYYDGWVGDIGYRVVLNSHGGAYYYQMQRDDNLQIPGNYFLFRGRLKPLTLPEVTAPSHSTITTTSTITDVTATPTT